MSLLPDVDRQLTEILRAIDHAAPDKLPAERGPSVLAALRHIISNQEKIMTKLDDNIAAIRANTDVLKSVGVAVGTLSEGHTTIAEEIQTLRDQIAQGQAPDFSNLDAAVADQKSVIDSLATAIPANTPAA